MENNMTLLEFQALRARRGYPNVAIPQPREWGRDGYSPKFYVHDQIKTINPNWDIYNLNESERQLVWERVRLFASDLKLEKDETTGMPRNPAGPTGVTGLGHMYNYGPNLTADSIVKWNDYLLLIVRGDTGQMAFPGGFRDPLDDSRLTYEDPEVAARREAQEETGLILPENIVPQEVYFGASPWSLRNTDIAWTYNWAGLFDISNHFSARPEVRGDDDAADARWVDIDAVNPTLMAASHAANFIRARKMLGLSY